MVLALHRWSRYFELASQLVMSVAGIYVTVIDYPVRLFAVVVVHTDSTVTAVERSVVVEKSFDCC